MIFSIRLSKGVEGELKEAADWIEEQRSGFGEKFIDAFEEALKNLSQFPYSYSIKFRVYRIVKIERFSYILIYKIIGDEVLISRLIHTNRRPSKRYYKV